MPSTFAFLRGELQVTAARRPGFRSLLLLEWQSNLVNDDSESGRKRPGLPISPHERPLQESALGLTFRLCPVGWVLTRALPPRPTQYAPPPAPCGHAASYQTQFRIPALGASP